MSGEVTRTPIRPAGTCANCRAWTMSGLEAEYFEGECRVNAPVRTTGDERPWPTTWRNEWCWFWRPVFSEAA